LLDNLRFDDAETTSNPAARHAFSFMLSLLADIDDSQLDISEASHRTVEQALSGTSMVFWNGAFGKIEEEAYQEGSFRIIRTLLAQLQDSENSIQRLFLSGGETAIMTKTASGLTEQTRHIPGLTISTGGGTSLRDLSHDVNNLGFDSLWGLPFEVINTGRRYPLS